MRGTYAIAVNARDVAAPKRSQVIVVSHAAALVDTVSSARDAVRVELAKEDGQTIVGDAIHWMSRPGNGRHDCLDTLDRASS
jgi:predicted ATPase